MKKILLLFVVGALLTSSAVVAWTAQTNSEAVGMLPARSMLSMGGVVTTPGRKASPLFMAKELPQPPEQHSSWSAPNSNLPANYLTATALLFEQGLADPRGCRYREIEVGTGSVWSGDGGVAKTHGWVLPGQSEPQFAICWNGLIYPTVSVGTNADLVADVMMALTNGFVSRQSALPEAGTLTPNALQGVKGCLLMRFGEVDLASAYWLALAQRETGSRNGLMPPASPRTSLESTNRINLSDADPYFTWASDWAWSLFDRIICAHQRGDERLALADTRRLVAAQPLIEAECANRGFKRQPYWDSRRNKEFQPYLSFLEQLPQIHADLERRDKEGPRFGAISSGLTNIADQAERVRVLIRDLDLAQARQWSQPGGVNLAEDPVVSALIGEGDAAVEPLLDCLEHDRRLTRSVGFGRDFHRGRTVLSVNSAAWVALRTILQAGFSNRSELHAYWNKYKDLKLEERWYAILNDDAARNRWQEAAANIVQPENVTHFPGGYSMERPAPTNTVARMRGQGLRGKRNPSVTELLTRHALEVPTNNIGAYDLAACCQMAEYLARWDIRAALPVAKTLSKRALTALTYSGQELGSYLTRLSLAAGEAGDPTAFDEYAEWIVKTTPEQFRQSSLECLEPLRKFPANAVLQKTAERIFGLTNSGWGNLPWKSDFGRSTVETELVALPAYRTLLCRELTKTNDCGTIDLLRQGYVRYNLVEQHLGGSFGVTLPDDSSITNGASATIRWCDWIALALANGKQIAPFNPFAPPEQRDRALLKAISQMQQPGK
jgi:hypothetical protein